VKSAICNRAAFEPFQRLVAGPLEVEDLPHIERFVRAVVLHDEMRMLPERFDLLVSEDRDVAIVPRVTRVEGFDLLGQYYDPLYKEDWETGNKLLASMIAQTSDDPCGSNKYSFDLRDMAVVLALANIADRGSAVVLDDAVEVVIAPASPASGTEASTRWTIKAPWEERLARAAEYPEGLFRQLDDTWQRYAREVALDGFGLLLPPVLGIVLSRCARRDAIPRVIYDLRNEWAEARGKVWERLDTLRTARTLGEALQIRRDLAEASKLFSQEPADHHSRPVRVLWEIAAAAVTGVGIAALSGGTVLVGAVSGAMTSAARSVPAALHEFGPALFGTGAFDLARKVRQATAQIEPGALQRLLSSAEKQKLGFR
jgi:hypothetical protein